MKQVSKISQVKIYTPGDHIDVSTGGILLRGGLSKLDKVEKKLAKKEEKVTKKEKRHMSMMMSTLSAQIQTQVL